MADGTGLAATGGIEGVARTVRAAMKANGTVRRLGVADGSGFVTRAVEALELTLEGIPGDRHTGYSRGADARTPWFRRGEPIQNARQLSLVSVEDLEATAAELGLPDVDPDSLGANLLVEGMPAFSFLPRGTLLFFPSGATLCVTDQNAPCRHAGRSLAEHHPGDDRLEFRFVGAAKRRRGVVARVEKAGRIGAGESFEARIPEQWLWSP